MINPLPALDRTDVTFKENVDLFFATQLPAFSVEAETTRVQINAQTIENNNLNDNCITKSSEATASAAAALASANLAASATGAVRWTSGTTYALGFVVWSPINSRTYRRTIAGAGTSDPSLDPINWSLLTLEITTSYPNIRPSLDLDFANSQTVDPRITFTRNSIATRTNSRGLIEVVPAGVPRIDFDPVTGACKGLLIEEQRVNLLTYSEQFDNAIWAKVRSAIATSTITAPDGTLTANAWIEDSATGVHQVFGVSASYTAGTSYTASIFAKLSAGTRFLQITLSASVFGDSNASNSAVFDLSSGTVTSGVSLATANITPAGSGFYRCAITKTASTTTSSTTGVIFALRTAYAIDVATGYTGDGTSGIYIWGAQLEAGTFPTSYQPSTETFTGRAGTATFYGSNGLIQTAASGVARMNYNPMNLTVQPKLLLEAGSANLLTYSNAMSTNWAENSNTDTTRTYNAAVSPSGATDATKLTCATTASAARTVMLVVSSLTAGATHCFSMYVKAEEYSGVQLWLYDLSDAINVNLDLLTGVATPGVGGVGVVSSAGATPVGGGWYRFSVAGVVNPTATTLTARVYLKPTGGSSGVFTGVIGSGIFIWGAQLEEGSYPTSYIPTVASPVTRIADTSTSAPTTRVADVAKMEGANFSSWYRQDEGTIAVEAQTDWSNTPASSTFRAIARVFNASGTSSISNAHNFVGSGSGSASASGVSQAALTSGSFTTSAVKQVMAYKADDFAFTRNAAAPSVDTSGVVPSDISFLLLGKSFDSNSSGYLNGHIRSLSYYPKRLTNAELQALSTQ